MPKSRKKFTDDLYEDIYLNTNDNGQRHVGLTAAKKYAGIFNLLHI
jgi:hypothetical protein